MRVTMSRKAKGSEFIDCQLDHTSRMEPQETCRLLINPHSASGRLIFWLDRHRLVQIGCGAQHRGVHESNGRGATCEEGEGA